MSDIFLISGPCGCGKTTLSNAFASSFHSPVCLIHGDDFQNWLHTPDASSAPEWTDVLRFNWRCILDVTRHALEMGVDVVIDYIVEDELPLLRELASTYGAELHYIVLTCSPDMLCERLQKRGDDWLIGRSLYLKEKLDSLPVNQGHLLPVTNLSTEEALSQLLQHDFRI